MAHESGLAPGAVALVTGASSGIGEAAAEALAARGCKVICTARRIDRLAALAERIGDNAYPLALDVTDAGAVAGLLDSLPAELRDIDILVNSAGHDIGGRRPFYEQDANDMASAVETNVIGLIRVTHALTPGMLRRGRGDIVHIGSVNAFEPPPNTTNYSGTKSAVHGLSRAMRADLKGSNVRVIEIMPGLTETEFAAARLGGDLERGREYYAGFAGIMSSEDIARSVVFALEQPRHVTIAHLVAVPSA